MFRILVSIALINFTGCVSKTIRDLPAFKDSKIHAPRLEKLTDRRVQLDIQDLRAKELKKESAKLIELLKPVILDVLTRARVEAEPSASNRLSIRVREHLEKGKLRDECVRLEAQLDFNRRFLIKASSLGCWEIQGAFGANVGSDISKAYETAFDYLFKVFDEEMAKGSWYDGPR